MARRVRCPRRPPAARPPFLPAASGGVPAAAALPPVRPSAPRGRRPLAYAAVPARPDAGTGVWISRAPAAIGAPDGYLRLTWPGLCETQFAHLFSGVDPGEDPGQAESLSAICGYTEWVSRDEPMVSLGWDWRLNFETGLLEPATTTVRSNLMLVGQDRADLGFRATERLLSRRLRGIDWQAVVAAAIGLFQ